MLRYGILTQKNYPWIPGYATGGTVVEDGDYRIHTFDATDVLTVTRTIDASIYVIGGGGSGGGTDAAGEGGGGGAGGLSILKLRLEPSTYDCSIGNKGVNSNGTLSAFGKTLAIAYGGGKGGHGRGYPTAGDSGNNGGSGGGGGTTSGAEGTNIAGTATHYGHNGAGDGGGGGGANSAASGSSGGSGVTLFGTTRCQGGRGGAYPVYDPPTDYYGWGGNGGKALPAAPARDGRGGVIFIQYKYK